MTLSTMDLADDDMYQQFAAEEDVPMDACHEWGYDRIVTLLPMGFFVPPESGPPMAARDARGYLLCVVSLGWVLHDIGGVASMKAVAYRLLSRGHLARYGDLLTCWDGIGEWGASDEPQD
ncbi:hypothetical protein [Nitrospira defluvii]|uniref:Uncharacterized protein n=1 Tax=Nitrospira defluvii TaxID=330214 RepID=A0ABM8RYV2_9BACT|nr:hypothetical protein [Nitrospira defluvii]CAE6779320.1 conserved hypothetical protein [Nitrospira defluvii]